MPPAQALINDTVGFLEDNILLVRWDGNAGQVDRAITKGTHQLYLHKPPADRAVGRRKNLFRTKIPVYLLAPTANPVSATYSVDPNPVTAYFCPYQGNLTLGTVISSAADLMFTTQMDGCSLGVGSVTPSGSRLVYHCNHGGGVGGRAEQTNAKDGDLRAAFGAAKLKHKIIGGIVSPADYRTSSKGTEYCSTTFGVRDPAANTWAFYSQRYAENPLKTPKEFVLKEVKRLF